MSKRKLMFVLAAAKYLLQSIDRDADQSVIRDAQTELRAAVEAAEVS